MRSSADDFEHSLCSDRRRDDRFLSRYDRIIELAVVRLGPGGRQEAEYCTLINPRRDVGPTHVHGITASDVAAAPTFEEVLGDVVELLSGAIIVGHNARFDLPFIEAEAARADYPLPAVPTLCTLQLSHRLGVALSRRRLHVCCEHAGIEAVTAHSAPADAIATAQLLLHYLDLARQQGFASLGDPRAFWPRWSSGDS